MAPRLRKFRLLLPLVPVYSASSLAASGENREANKSFIAHTEVLTRAIRAEAGMKPSTQWFYRRVDSTGVGGNGLNLDPGLIGRELTGDAFPSLLLRDHWDGDTQETLVEEYHQWQSPYLLTHTNLSHNTRRWLEQAASQQAERLYSVRNLLPEIINKDLIETALVEAVIRRTAVA